MNNPKINMSACIIDYKFVYGIGGFTNEGKMAEMIERFSIEFNTWEPIQL